MLETSSPRRWLRLQHYTHSIRQKQEKKRPVLHETVVCIQKNQKNICRASRSQWHFIQIPHESCNTSYELRATRRLGHDKSKGTAKYTIYNVVMLPSSATRQHGRNHLRKEDNKTQHTRRIHHTHLRLGLERDLDLDLDLERE